MAKIKNLNSFIEKRIEKLLASQLKVLNLKNEGVEARLGLALFEYCRSYTKCMRHWNFKST